MRHLNLTRGGLPSLLLAAFLSLGGAACGRAAAPPPKSAIVATVTAEPLAAAQFPAAALLALRADDRSSKTKGSLASVVQHQLLRAEHLFAAGHTKAGEDVVVGALLLLRGDDALDVALRGRILAVLTAAHSASRLGDSGRAQGLYQHALRLAPEADVAESIVGHLAAIARFGTGKATSPMITSSEHARRAMSLAMVDPSEAAFVAAKQAIIQWLQLAVASSRAEQPTSFEAREDAMEVYSAFSTGAPALVALCLRHGDPMQAVEVLEGDGLARALPPPLRELLLKVGQDKSAEAWLQLFQLQDEGRRQDGQHEPLPPYVADGAALWAAIGLYRAGDGSLENAMPLAMLLLEFGMPEVAARLLSEEIDEDAPKQALAWSVSVVMRALLDLGETGQLEAARLALSQSERLLRLAQTAGISDSVRAAGSPSELLASIEIRAGYPARALPLLRRAAEERPSSETWLRLAEVSEQQGDLDHARLAFERAAELARDSGDVLSEARAHELLFELERDRQDPVAAAAALESALKRTLTARAMKLPEIPESAFERTLARLLGHYGRGSDSRAAYERALRASRSSMSELSLTLTEMARSALSGGDVRLAKAATQGALDFALPTDDLVYIALWQMLLEQSLGLAPDALAAQALSEAPGASGWITALRQFGLNRLDPSGLATLARGIPQGLEAVFYGALVAKDAAVRERGLREVASGPGIDLLEARIARGLLARAAATAPPAFPSEVSLQD